MSAHIGILGLGYLGSHISRETVWSEKSWASYHEEEQRSMAGFDHLIPIRFDWELSNTWPHIPNTAVTLVLTIPPMERNPETESKRLIAWAKWMNSHRPLIKNMVYISTTGVYPNQAGEWHESCDLEPDTDKGKLRLNSEKVLARFFNLKVVRAGAIYGPERHIAKRILEKKPIPRGDHPVHRIHVVDLAQIVEMAITQPSFPKIVNAVDTDSSPSAQVAEWTARQSFFPKNAPCEIRYQDGYFNRKNLTPNPQRIISNKLLISLPGFRYHYPSYREGIQQAVMSDL